MRFGRFAFFSEPLVIFDPDFFLALFLFDFHTQSLSSLRLMGALCATQIRICRFNCLSAPALDDWQREG